MSKINEFMVNLMIFMAAGYGAGLMAGKEAAPCWEHALLGGAIFCSGTINKACFAVSRMECTTSTGQTLTVQNNQVTANGDIEMGTTSVTGCTRTQ